MFKACDKWPRPLSGNCIIISWNKLVLVFHRILSAENIWGLMMVEIQLEDWGHSVVRTFTCMRRMASELLSVDHSSWAQTHFCPLFECLWRTGLWHFMAMFMHCFEDNARAVKVITSSSTIHLHLMPAIQILSLSISVDTFCIHVGYLIHTVQEISLV